ncbi:MAG: DinB family protein [Deltaproteobacteria bacterium]|nr:DinB family protein [Deltaproteobacteria bacterium]
MQTKAAIKAVLSYGSFLVSKYISDLEESEILVRPAPSASHIAYQLGHLIVSEYNSMQCLAPGLSPALSEEFISAHAKENQGSSSSELFYQKNEYVELGEAQREATLGILQSYDEDRLSDPGPEKMRSYAPTAGHVFIMQGVHQLNHSGQFVVVRRLLGKPVLI